MHCTLAVDETVHVPNMDWDDFVSQLNNSLNKLDLEFARAHDEETGKEMWALVSVLSDNPYLSHMDQVNRRDDDVATVASDYSPQDIAYFKSLVSESF
jgi:non-structural maintenance of chromosomes element 1